MPILLVAIPTYNELGNLPPLIDAILARFPDADILVVDDNSPDGTGRWCDQRAARETRLVCLHRPAKEGLGTATIAAMRYAIQRDYDMLATMDADFSHDPDSLPELVSAITAESADLVIGSRYCQGGAIVGWPWWRRITSRLVNAATRRMLDLAPIDCSGAFRVYRVDALRKIDLSAIRAKGYAYLEEILWRLVDANARWTEIPITFRNRHIGRSKLGLQEAIRTLSTLLRLARERKQQKHA